MPVAAGVGLRPCGDAWRRQRPGASRRGLLIRIRVRPQRHRRVAGTGATVGAQAPARERAIPKAGVGGVLHDNPMRADVPNQAIRKMSSPGSSIGSDDMINRQKLANRRGGGGPARRHARRLRGTYCTVRSGPLCRRLQQRSAGFLARGGGRDSRAGLLGRQSDRRHGALRHRSPHRTGRYADRQRRRPERRRTLRVRMSTRRIPTLSWCAIRHRPRIRVRTIRCPPATSCRTCRRAREAPIFADVTRALPGAAVLARTHRQPAVGRLHQGDALSSRAGAMSSSPRSTATCGSPTSSSTVSAISSTRC